MHSVIAIPARWSSSRFPGKILADLDGIPVLKRVWTKACAVTDVDEVVVLVDEDMVRQEAMSWGAKVITTSPDCSCGTERIASALDRIEGDFIINLQADEPLLDINVLKKIVQFAKNNDCEMVTPVFKLVNSEDIFDQNLVKVVVNSLGEAMYFSRSTIPFIRDEKDRSKWLEAYNFLGHIGVYGYAREVLLKYYSLKSSKLEDVEKLEQLRFLDNGFRISTLMADGPTIEINTPEDMQKALEFLKNSVDHRS
ncbi:MAG: 3-deoxy-manno-octulosonate cytidylyltransferase [Puniceicoccales bacterium]|jgi:3-deoxy-manno-octulosonate cytidylyltransferase (CMP-KDO synthetase)|nr:3-deoxy-manno-octulosonate cytidylyltransferase [Puniceicoccales bacterium]